MAVRVKCGFRGCNGWAFEKALCRQHAKSHPEVNDALAVDWTPYRTSQAAMTGLVVATPSDNPVHVDLPAGTPVEVVCMCQDNTTAVCREKNGSRIGYFPYYNLATEQQVYEQYMRDLEAARERRKVEEKAEQKRAEQAYETAMRQNAVLKAEQEARERAFQLEMARIEAERQRKLAEERERLAAAELAQKEAEYKAWLVEQERIKAQRQQEMLEEARVARLQADSAEQQRRQLKEREKVEWEEAQRKKKDEEYLNSLPGWKRDLVLRKRTTSTMRK